MRRFLRVGTSGLLQPSFMKGGDLVIATASVRDEGTSRCYVPIEYPAVSSIEFVLAAQRATKKINLAHKTHTGIIHSKDSLFAREFSEGLLSQENKRYMGMLCDAGVIASEMEASLLFTLANLFNHQLRLKTQKNDYIHSIKAGAICVVLGEGSDFGTPESLQKMTEEINKLALQTIMSLAEQEMTVQ